MTGEEVLKKAYPTNIFNDPNDPFWSKVVDKNGNTNKDYSSGSFRQNWHHTGVTGPAIKTENDVDPKAYYNVNSKHGKEHYDTAKALIVTPKWKWLFVGGPLIAFFYFLTSGGMIMGWVDEFLGEGRQIPTLREVFKYMFGFDFAGDYVPVDRAQIFEDIGRTALSYIPEWIPHQYQVSG